MEPDPQDDRIARRVYLPTDNEVVITVNRSLELLSFTNCCLVEPRTAHQEIDCYSYRFSREKEVASGIVFGRDSKVILEYIWPKAL